MLTIIASAAKKASRWPSGSATTMPCMPYIVLPALKLSMCISATTPSVICVSQKVSRRCGSVTHRSTSVIRQAIASSSISG